jgi:hypothetical protein
MSIKESRRVTNGANAPSNGVPLKSVDLGTIDLIEGKLWVGYQRLLSSHSSPHGSSQSYLLSKALIDAVQVTMAVIKKVRADVMRETLDSRSTRGK